MKTLTTALLAFAAAGCGAANAGIVEDLGITARSAFLEARTEARSWSTQTQLRYVEGLGIAADGRALQGTGEWRFHYTAPGKTGELLVRVTPLEMVTEERAATSPPGYVIGTNTLSSSWVDSPEAMATVLQANPGGASQFAELLLVPTSPHRWVVRFPEVGSERWTVNAETGTLMQGS